MIYINDNIDAFDVEAALPLLSEERREQTLRFRFERGRKTCAAAYLLLCEGLKKEYGITEKPLFSYGPHGKPASHYKESVAHYTMSQQEMHQILHADRPDVMFTRLWTMKEAVLKLSGEGLRDNLKEVLADVDCLNIETIVSEDERYVYSVAREKE